MITLNTLDIILLALSIISIVINIIQYQKQHQMEKEKFIPIYDGLVGLFNDVKNKNTNLYMKQNLLYSKDNPYKEIETLKWNFWEFITENITHLDSLREQIVPILKTIDPSEERVFTGVEFRLTNQEKNTRKILFDNMQERLQKEQEIRRLETMKKLEELKKTEKS